MSRQELLDNTLQGEGKLADHFSNFLGSPYIFFIFGIFLLLVFGKYFYYFVTIFYLALAQDSYV